MDKKLTKNTKTWSPQLKYTNIPYSTNYYWQYNKTQTYLIPYSGNLSRTINFAIFMDFTATLKINLQKSYYIVYKCNDSLVDPRNLICKMYHSAVTSKIFSLENYPLYGNSPVLISSEYWNHIFIHINWNTLLRVT